MAALACALGAPAIASAFDAKLVVGTSTPGLPSTRITASFDRGNAPIGKIQIYVPTGYTLKAPASGAVGSANAIVFVTDVNGEENMRGNVTVARATDPIFTKIGPTCDNVAHQAAWAVNVTGAGADWNIPVYVDATTGSETQFGATKIVVCLPPPVVPPTADNSLRAPNGQRLISLTMNLTVLSSPASGDVRWRALATPYKSSDRSGAGDEKPGSTTLDPAASLEAQSILTLPQRLTLAVKKHGKTATLSGRLTQNGKPVGATLVQLQVSKTKRRLTPYARIKTNGSGTFTKSFAIPGTRYFRAVVTTGDRDLGAAACTKSFGFTCAHAFAGGSQLYTQLVRVA
jgi:hypothetical protein